MERKISIMTNTNQLLDNLNKSFDILDRAIDVMQFTLGVKINVPPEIIERISKYKEIVQKQRNFASELPKLIFATNEKEPNPEVFRILNIIKQLSAMIKDDVLEVNSIIVNQQLNR